MRLWSLSNIVELLAISRFPSEVVIARSCSFCKRDAVYSGTFDPSLLYKFARALFLA